MRQRRLVFYTRLRRTCVCVERGASVNATRHAVRLFCVFLLVKSQDSRLPPLCLNKFNAPQVYCSLVPGLKVSAFVLWVLRMSTCRANSTKRKSRHRYVTLIKTRAVLTHLGHLFLCLHFFVCFFVVVVVFVVLFLGVAVDAT